MSILTEKLVLNHLVFVKENCESAKENSELKETCLERLKTIDNILSTDLKNVTRTFSAETFLLVIETAINIQVLELTLI
jgi:hypothetical protein